MSNVASAAVGVPLIDGTLLTVGPRDDNDIVGPIEEGYGVVGLSDAGGKVGAGSVGASVEAGLTVGAGLIVGGPIGANDVGASVSTPSHSAWAKHSSSSSHSE